MPLKLSDTLVPVAEFLGKLIAPITGFMAGYKWKSANVAEKENKEKDAEIVELKDVIGTSDSRLAIRLRHRARRKRKSED